MNPLEEILEGINGYFRVGAGGIPNAIQIGIDPGQVDALVHLFGADAIKTALYRAIKRTLQSARARLGRKVAEDLNIGVETAKDAITTSAGNYNDLTGKVIISRKPLRADKFKNMSLSRGDIAVQFRKDRPKLVIGQGKAFEWDKVTSTGEGDTPSETKRFFLFRTKHLPKKGPNANRTYKRPRRIFAKEGDKPLSPVRGMTPEGFASRYATATPYGPSVFKAMGGEGGSEDLLEKAADDLTEQFEKNLSSQIDLLMAQKNGSAGT